jgi:hypothetical protein
MNLTIITIGLFFYCYKNVKYLKLTKPFYKELSLRVKPAMTALYKRALD